MEPIHADEIPELLSRLVDKSLVQYDEEAGRYSLLQLIREYGREEAMRGDEWPPLRTRHLSYFRDLTLDSRARSHGPHQAEEFDRISTEHENLRIAAEWGGASPDLWHDAMSITRQIYSFWFTRCMYEEGVRWMTSLGESVPPNSEFVLAELKFLIVAFLERQANPDANSKIEEAIALAIEAGNTEVLGECLFVKGLNEWRLGNLAEAEDSLKKSLQLSVELKNDGFAPHVRVNLANLALYQGRLDEALAYYEQVQQSWERIGNVRGLGVVHGNLCQVCERLGDYEGMHRHALAAMAAFAPLGDNRNLAAAMGGSSNGFWYARDPAQAARILGCSDAILKREGIRLDEIDAQTYDRLEERYRTTLGSEYERAFEEGTLMPADEMIEFLFANPEPWASPKL